MTHPVSLLLLLLLPLVAPLTKHHHRHHNASLPNVDLQKEKDKQLNAITKEQYQDKLKEQKENLVVDLKKQVKTEVENMQAIESEMRLKGTFTLALAQLDDNLNDPSNKYYQQDQPTRYFPSQMIPGMTQEPPESASEIKQNLFLLRVVELPNLCKTALSMEERVSLAQVGAALMDCWQNAAYKKDQPFVRLPYLLSDELASFYACSLHKSHLTPGPDTFTEEEAKAQPELFLNTVLFNTDPKTQVYRTRACWLEFWEYTCARGDPANRPPSPKITPQDTRAQLALDKAIERSQFSMGNIAYRNAQHQPKKKYKLLPNGQYAEERRLRKNRYKVEGVVGKYKVEGVVGRYRVEGVRR